jgi:hypothetical protein
MMDKDKAIRAAKLTAGAVFEKNRAKTAVTRAGGQIAPSKYLTNVPRAVHADGGAANAPMFQGIHPSLQNESGEPIDLYHGTTQDKEFDAFDNSKLGVRDVGFYGRGHYLTPDRSGAEEYANSDDTDGTVMGPLHTALKNPYIWDVSSDMKAHSTLRDLQSMGIMKEKSELRPWDNLQQHHIAPFMAEMKKRGHDGVIMKTDNEDLPNGIAEVVAFNPSTIKHKDAEAFDPNDPRIRRDDGGKVARKINEHGLYSKALEVARNMQQTKGTPEQFMAQLKNTKGVKQAEIDSIGMPKGEKITKDDFIRHISSNLPRLGMTQYGADPSFLSPEDQKFLRYATNNKNLTPEEDEKRRNLDQRRMRNIGHSTDDEGNSETNYQDYITGGGKNYRERLIKLTGDKQYQSSHWEPANVLAHVRMQDRTGPSGEKLLHVEEIQSDWGQQGRKKGFYDPKNPYEVSNRKTGEVMSKHPSYNSFPEEQSYQDFDYLNAATKKAPIAPFVQNTQQWTDMAMKQILREAALGDYDGVVFTPSQAQSDRYGQADASGMKNYYDSIVPKSAMNLVRQHDPSTQPQSMNINGEYDALHIPLSDTAKNSIEKNGFQMFKDGGLVDNTIAATRRFTKDGIGATMSLKPRGK